MSEHTPGPWEFDGVCQIVEVARPHMRICFLPSDHHKYASSVPNGHLIAAAPELLAALKQIVDQDNAPLIFWTDDAWGHKMRDDIVAAIAKAESK